MDEIYALLDAPGLSVTIRWAPVFGGILWLWLTVLLWRDGFNDLAEQLTRPRWKGRERARAIAMLPVRALMLTGVAGIGAAMTTLGLLFNLAVILNIVAAIRSATAG